MRRSKNQHDSAGRTAVTGNTTHYQDLQGPEVSDLIRHKRENGTFVGSLRAV